MSFVNEVTEKILKQGLDALDLSYQQFDKLEKTKVVETHPLEVKILVNNEIFVPNAARENLNENTMSGASHSISDGEIFKQS